MLVVRKDKLQLVKPSDEILHSKLTPYDFDKDGDPESLVNVLFQRMKELGGIGLSANQVGLDRRMFVMGVENPISIFNPEIITYMGEEISFKEGCLTYPGLFIYIKRPPSIQVKFQNQRGETIETELTGLTSRIFQHEYDHMEGKDFTERVSKLKLDLAKKKYSNLKKKIIKKHAVQTMIDALNQQ